MGSFCVLALDTRSEGKTLKPESLSASSHWKGMSMSHVLQAGVLNPRSPARDGAVIVVKRPVVRSVGVFSSSNCRNLAHLHA